MIFIYSLIAYIYYSLAQTRLDCLSVSVKCYSGVPLHLLFQLDTEGQSIYWKSSDRIVCKPHHLSNPSSLQKWQRANGFSATLACHTVQIDYLNENSVACKLKLLILYMTVKHIHNPHAANASHNDADRKISYWFMISSNVGLTVNFIPGTLTKLSLTIYQTTLYDQLYIHTVVRKACAA